MSTVTTTTKKTAKVITAKERAARVEKFQASEYNQRVNVVHRATKAHGKTLSGSRSTLLNAKEEAKTALTPNFVKILKASKKSKAVWSIAYKHWSLHSFDIIPFYIFRDMTKETVAVR